MVQGYVSIYFPADLMTTDGKLHVSQNPVAVLDPTTDQWCVELHCGTFTYSGQPPFDVQWIVSDNILSKKGMDKNTSVTLFCLMHSWQNFVRFLRSSLFLFFCSVSFFLFFGRHGGCDQYSPDIVLCGCLGSKHQLTKIAIVILMCA